MGETTRIIHPDEREASLGLWAVPGLGTITIEALETSVGGDLARLVDEPVKEWASLVKCRGEAPRDFLNCVTTLRELAGLVRQRAEEKSMKIAFPGDPNYPEALLDLRAPPRVLFHYGEMSAPRRRAGIVGSRRTERAVLDFARELTEGLARAGVGVISGAAIGVDTAGHEGALRGGGETWAFLASSLDEMDSTQKPICRQILRAGGMVFTEYPPHTRAQKESFPRRNRLVSGAADVVISVRAAAKSGTRHTILHAVEQGRTLMVVPGDPWSGANDAGNQALADGSAIACCGFEDVLRALHIPPERVTPAKVGVSLEQLKLSGQARKALLALTRKRRVFDDILEASRLDASELVSALTELELNGLAIQHPGKVYERV